MKLNLTILTGITAASLLSGVFATDAVTDPVGYITLTVPGGSNPTISYLGTSGMVNPTTYGGTPTGNNGASQVDFAANSFTGGAFGDNSLGQPFYYVEISDSSVPGDIGLWTDIDSNTTDSLTLVDPIAAKFSVAGVKVKVRKHLTLAQVFGDGTLANPLKLTGGVDVNSADLVEFVNFLGTTVNFFNTEEEAWFSGATASNERVIAPGDGLRVSRRGAATTVSLVGNVKTGITQVAVEPGVNLISSTLAVPTSGAVGSPIPLDFDNSNLIASGLVGGVDVNTADNILQISGLGATTDLIYNTEEEGYFAGATNVGTNVIAEGTAIRLFHRGAGFSWKIPAVLIAP